MANIIYPPIVTVLFQFEKINNGMPLKNSKNERKLDRVRIWSPSLWNSTITIGDKSLKKGVANKKTSKLPALKKSKIIKLIKLPNWMIIGNK